MLLGQILFLSFALSLGWGKAIAVESSEHPKGKQDAKDDGQGPKDNKAKADDFVWTPPVTKKFTKKQIKAECHRYEGQYIGYYSRVYWVNQCKLRELADEDLIGRLLQKHNVVVKNVEGDTIAMIPKGPVLRNLPKEVSHKRNCRELNGHYVIYGGSEIFYVEHCKRRELPDYETFIKHSKEGSRNQFISELTSAEFYGIPVGPQIPSILADVAKKLMDISAEVDVIPVNEACHGIEGQYVSYYSEIYLIEKCKKRKIDDLERFLAKKTRENFKKPVELSSQQWISLPDGAPVIIK